MVDRVQTTEINKQCRYKWCSAKGGGGSEGQSSMVHGAKERRGGETGESWASWQPDVWSCPLVCWSSPGDSTVSSLMAADWRSYVTGGWDHLQCRGLCGWDGCCRCPGGRGERHQQSSQLLSLCVKVTCGRMRCKRHTTQWCSWSGCSRWCLCRRCTWWGLGLWLFWVCRESRDATLLSWPVLQCC